LRGNKTTGNKEREERERGKEVILEEHMV